MLIGLIALYIFICGLIGAIGAQKKLGFLGTFLISLFLTPIGGVIALVVSDRRQKGRLKAESRGEPWTKLNREGRKLEMQNHWEAALEKYKTALYELKKYKNITEGRREERQAKIHQVEKKIQEIKTKMAPA